MQFYEINGLCDLGPVSAWILKEIFGGMRYCNFSLLYPTQPQLFSSYSPSWSDVLGTLMTKLEMILNIHCFFVIYSMNLDLSLVIFSSCPNSPGSKFHMLN